MMRYIMGLALCLILTSCWSRSDDTVATGPTACPYQEPQDVPTYKWSPFGDTLSITIDQEKLTRFMSLSASEAPCYLASNGAIELAQVPSDSGEANPEFKTFPLASEQTVENWRVYTDNFQNGLMGLTTIRFSGGTETETIKGIQISIRGDARRWHLWHEYSHALIGQARATNKNQSLYIPTESFLDKKLSALKELDIHTDEYAAELQKLVQAYRDRIDKSFIDEILIEATLIDLTLQHAEDLKVEDEDYFRTLNAIEFFTERYDKALRKTRKDLIGLLKDNEEVATNRMTIVRVIVHLADQHRKIKDIAEQATSQIQFQ